MTSLTLRWKNCAPEMLNTHPKSSSHTGQTRDMDSCRGRWGAPADKAAPPAGRAPPSPGTSPPSASYRFRRGTVVLCPTSGSLFSTCSKVTVISVTFPHVHVERKKPRSCG